MRLRPSTKRNIVWLVLLSFLQLQLVSCGSSSELPPSISVTGVGVATLPRANGTVVLPPGSQVALSSLVVTSSQDQATVGSDGTYSLLVTNGTEPLLVGVTSQGKLMMFGFVTGGTGGNDISPTSTAVALLYYVLGVFNLPNSQQQQALKLLQQDPTLAALLAAVNTSLLANPTALTDGDSVLVAAVQAAQQAVLARANTPASQAAATHLARDAGGPSTVTVDPTGAQSGATVAPSGSGGLTATNTFRRQSEFFVYQTGDTPPNSPENVLPTAQPVTTAPVVLGEVSGVSTIIEVLTALISLSTGNGAAYISTTVTLVSQLAVQGSDASTQYAVVMISPSLKGTLPAIFGDSHFAPYVSMWMQEFTKLQFLSFFFDMVMPIIGSVFGGRDLIIGATGQAADSVVQQLLLALSQGTANVSGLIQKGQWTNAVTDIFTLMSKDTGVLLAVSAIASKFVATGSQNFASDLLGFLSKANVWLNCLQLLLGAQDVARVLSDLNNSNEAESWQVNVSASPSPSPNPGSCSGPVTTTFTKPQSSNMTYSSFTMTPGQGEVFLEQGQSTFSVTLHGTGVPGGPQTVLACQLPSLGSATYTINAQNQLDFGLLYVEPNPGGSPKSWDGTSGVITVTSTGSNPTSICLTITNANFITSGGTATGSFTANGSGIVPVTSGP